MISIYSYDLWKTYWNKGKIKFLTFVCQNYKNTALPWKCQETLYSGVLPDGYTSGGALSNQNRIKETMAK